MKTKMAEELEERLSDEDNNRQVLSIPFVSFREDFFCKFAFVQVQFLISQMSQIPEIVGDTFVVY